jgi:hypothetical protein
VSLFGGILRDRPENPIAGIDLSSGGRVEGEIFCHVNLLIFLRELKHRSQMLPGPNFQKALAQLLCELYGMISTIH